ncbi:MAG: GNAT family N-acetyltransferase [Candidatus Omnitrophica bacterium]|nr:GNAT family N-acetyltransferase [Candidatus Omnitrophota bacterium]MCA9415893.1 GNAT family N-acetyltransferase [Candidatus Omnitrophota bacterium]MCA9431643.1 GNAT family N-acetyltransferase [Candidatus Omnitrophota bacterium]MCA9435352.1 GNAT family N-acetyltransferase [Candidatus Omnitrophota bacterium]MCA9443142.1 GNAT family N-acetyltransferase [Candidatus Omnitrophota bacterium]
MEQKQQTFGVVYRKATLGEIIDLREEILIKGTDRNSPEFDMDHFPDTLHMGAFTDGKNIACLSLMRVDYEGQTAYQLRGMAVRPEFRNKGFGKSLLNFSERWVVRHSSVRLLWCNARTSAVDYYVRLGWERVSEEFTIEGVGPHVRMIRRIGSGPRAPRRIG